MLLPRILTAVVLLAVLLPAIFIAPPWVWGGVSLLFLVVAAQEWVRLLPGAHPGNTPPSPVRAWLLPVGLLLAGIATLFWRAHHDWPGAALPAAMGLLGLFWMIAGPRRLYRHESREGGQWLVAVALFGCWLALFELRLHGTYALISSMAVIWIADIAAYFVGRAIGRRKLAPSISPGKSWEGAIGGALAVVLAGLVVAWAAGAVWPAAQGSLPARLVGGLGYVGAAVVLIGLSALSVVGDLHESLLKRQAGVKDSGSVLPGHGGVLDRIDALIPTMPVALLAFDLLR